MPKRNKSEGQLKFSKAIDLLFEDLTLKEICRRINEINPVESKKFFISEGYFNKYVNHPHYEVGGKKFKKIVESLEKIIFEKYKKIWNTLAENFTDVDALDTEDVKQGYKILNHLKGHWAVYTWDEKKTKKEHGIPHVHMFKINVIAQNSVYCETGQATFRNSKIIAIGETKLGIELIKSDRIILMIIHVGNIQGEDSSDGEPYHFGYSDSGRYEIKAGVGILEKINSFEKLNPQSIQLSVLQNEKPNGFFDEIINKQFIVKF